MTTINKEFFEKTLNRLQLTNKIDDDFLMLMYEYYKEYFPESKQYVNEFGEFKNLLYLWTSIPVMIENQIDTIRTQTYHKGIQNTINHFKQKFNN